MISTVAIFVDDVQDVQVNAADTMATIVGKNATVYLHGTREERLAVLRSWAWAESMFLAPEISKMEIPAA